MIVVLAVKSITFWVAIQVTGFNTSVNQVKLPAVKRLEREPHRTILGPIWFLRYINYITKRDINCKIALFADNTSISKTSRKTIRGVNTM